nr:hypothetical protein [Actinomycetota bacterium]
ANSGQTVTVRVGDSVQLLLDDPAMQWSPPKVAPDGLLTPAPASAPPPHGRLVIWTAAHTGTVKVTAVGTAWCPAGVACPMYARLFDLTIVIS